MCLEKSLFAGRAKTHEDGEGEETAQQHFSVESVQLSRATNRLALFRVSFQRVSVFPYVSTNISTFLQFCPRSSLPGAQRTVNSKRQALLEHCQYNALLHGAFCDSAHLQQLHTGMRFGALFRC